MKSATVRRASAPAPRLMLAIVFTVAVAIAAIVSLMVGARAISVSDVVLAVFDLSDGTDAVVVRTLRVPRMLLAVLAGCALAVAGALIQALTRNPLADPGLIGVNAGASLAVVTAMTVLGWSGVIATTGAAMIGAVAALVIVLVMAWRRSASPITVVLVGTAVTAAIGGVTSAMLILDARALDQVRFWSIGSLTGRDPDVLWPTVALVAIAVALGLSLSIPLSTMALGEDMASTLGTSPVRTRILVLVAVALLCGAATAAAGPIGFVGLAVPFFARRLARADVRWTLIFSAILGPLLMLVADTVGRLIAWPGEVEVGVVVAVVGAPLLIVIARSARIEKP